MFKKIFKDENITADLIVKRLLIYVAGLFCMAFSVSMSAASGLGVGPVGSPANVFSLIASSRGWPSVFNLGNSTILLYVIYLILEKLLLGKDFKAYQLLQLVASLLFGRFIIITGYLVALFPAPQTYLAKMIYLLISIPPISFGVLLYLAPDLVPTPGDGMSIAISKKTGFSLGISKLIFDCIVVALSALASFIFFHALVGVREGTIISALTVGPLLRYFQNSFGNKVLEFVGVKTKVHRAMEAYGAYNYTFDYKGDPRIIVAIGREFGSGGYEIGQCLAKKMNIPFYDRQIDERASEISGMPMEKIRELENHMERELVYNFKYSAYNMTNEDMTPAEELFAAQSAAIREIASRPESCVIIGRSCDYTLYDNPDCFRIFIHALPKARLDRLERKYGISREQAEIEMKNTDTARSRHYKHFTGREYGHYMYYHLNLDSSTLGVDESAELIQEALNRWGAIRGTQPLKKI